MKNLVRIVLLIISLISAIWYSQANQLKLVSLWTLIPLISLIVPICVARLIRERFASTIAALFVSVSLIGLILFIRQAIHGGREGLEWFGVIFFFTLFHTVLIWGCATAALCAMRPNYTDKTEPYSLTESPSSIRSG